ISGITTSSSGLANATFDYIVCGGGLTGLTIANRLSEDPSVSVLVIEAGYDNHTSPLISDVRTYGLAFDTELDHRIYSTPVKWQHGERLLLVAGKTLGGSGSLNGASWTKGAKSQYNLLPLLSGDESWGWASFNQYMLKAENFHRPTDSQRDIKGAHYESGLHGYGGPVQVSFGSGMYGGTQLPALEASENALVNFSRNFDAASGQTSGGTIIPNMVVPEENQNRSSPFTAHAHSQVQERNNLIILTGHRVTKIVWRDTKKGAPLVAAGVHFQSSQNSPIEFVKTNREVLLAAGSLQSPQILELSGVGDAHVLEAAGVELKHELNGVGAHMQEQTKNTLTYQARPGINYNGTGPPSSIAFPNAAQLLGDNATTWYRTVKSSLKAYANSLKARSLVANAEATHYILQTQLENLFTAPDVAASEIFFTINSTANLIGTDNWNLIVLSRGTAHIRSNSSWNPPIVNPSYFDHPLDQTFQLATQKISRKIFNAEPLSSYVVEELEPGLPRVPINASDGVWEAWMKEEFTSVWHYLGTCAMMKEEFGGVVDSRLKVYGVRNVRVVDASVVPIQLSAHLSSSLYGIAEKGADMIQ
ncbi:uncharacterized protein MYCFIDRAFT_116284, partial [Pseudocercospora fijiensis CIRAD86]